MYIHFIVLSVLLLGHFRGAFPGSHDGLEISLTFCTSLSPPPNCWLPHNPFQLIPPLLVDGPLRVRRALVSDTHKICINT